MLVRCIWQACTAGIGRRGGVSFLALLCFVGVAEPHPCLRRRTGTRRVMDPPALVFIPSLALLSALVSPYHPVTPQKAELSQYRIPEPLILANPVPFPVVSNDCPNLEFSPPTILPLAGKFPDAGAPFPVYLWKCIKNKQRPLDRKQRRRKRTFKVQNTVSC